jgi:hypothetical protein
VFCVDKQQSILLGSPVEAQLREALSALEGKIAPVSVSTHPERYKP